jgi:hypothetical protein
MIQVGFEHTIPVFERAKTFHALDRAATDRHLYRHLLQIRYSTHVHLVPRSRMVELYLQYPHVMVLN